MNPTTHDVHLFLTIAVAGLLCSIAGMSAVADTLSVEAEALVDLYADTGGVQATTYDNASGGASLRLNKHPLDWTVQPAEAGTYYFWLRARSGWSGDRFFSETAPASYSVTMGPRSIAMQAQHDTLEWHGDGENFVWFRSEPLNLDAVEQTLRVRSAWEWAHVDRLVLTDDGDHQPALGNVAANAQRAGRLGLWTGSAYTHPLKPDLAPPPDAADTVDLTAPRGGTASAGVFLRLESDSKHAVPFRMFTTPLRGPGGATLPADALEVSLVASTGMRQGAPLASDALPRINAMGAFDLGPDTTRMFWLMARVPRDATPGDYTGSITFENQISLEQRAVPVRLRVARAVIEPRLDDLAVFSWWGYHNRPASWWNDQIDHGINTFLLYIQHDLRYRFESDGQLAGPIDFSGLDPLLDAWQRTRGWVVVQWYLHDEAQATLVCRAPGAEPGAPLPLLTEPWRKAFTTLLTRTQTYLESQGVPRDRILHYTFDEYLGDRFVQVSQIIRAIDPSYQIFSDLSADLETYQRVNPYLDVWCPYFGDLEAMADDGRLAYMRSTGKPIWFYDPGYLQRGEAPYAKSRVKFWRAWRYQLDGCTYWKHQGDRVGTAYYPMIDGDPPVTSRRYEAWFSGWQDYQLLQRLSAVADGDGEQARAAAALLDEAVSRVCDNPTDTTLADHYRKRILTLVDQVAETASH